MGYSIREMTMGDYEEVYRLWEGTAGVCLGDEDGREGIGRYLRRNAGLCFVAMEAGAIIGVSLSGHDGRRGILRHLAVAKEHRKRGIGKALVRACLERLAAEGISACNVFVMDDNPEGLRFWEHLGFQRLEENWQTLQQRTGKDSE